MMNSRSIKVCFLLTAVFLATAGGALAQPNNLFVVTTTANLPGNSNCQNQPGAGGVCPDDDACVQEGNYGLRCRTFAGSDNAVFVQADANNGFNEETVVRELFWFNPRDMQANHGSKHFINSGDRTGGVKPAWRVVYRRNQNLDEHKLLLACLANCQGGVDCPNKRTGRLTLDPGWSQVLVEWAHSDPAPAPANGICRISIIGGETRQVSNLRNTQATVIGSKLGIFGAPQSPSTVGDHCFDDFQSFRTLAPQ